MNGKEKETWHIKKMESLLNDMYHGMIKFHERLESFIDSAIDSVVQQRNQEKELLTIPEGETIGSLYHKKQMEGVASKEKALFECSSDHLKLYSCFKYVSFSCK